MRVNQQGRSMIEMLGVLAIIGVLSVGGIAGYSKAMGKYKTNQVVDQVSMIVTNIRTLYAQQMDYSGLTTLSATNMGVVPDELVNKKASTLGQGVWTAVSLRNGFQGDVIISAANSRSGESTAYTAFTVEFDGLSRDACVAIATSDWGSGSASGFIGLSVKNTSHVATAPSGGTGGGAGGSSAIGTSETGGTGGGAGGGAAASADARDTNAATDTDTTLYIGCPGVAATTGSATACPNGTAQTVPLSVTAASQACACQSGNTCSIVWKYF